MAVIASIVLATGASELAWSQQQKANAPIPLPGTGTKLDFEVIRNCVLPPDQEDLLIDRLGQRLPSTGTSPPLKSYNMNCDHQYLLREGVSIHTLHKAYMDRKRSVFAKFTQDAKAGRLSGIRVSDALVGHFAYDGTCFYKDYLKAKQGDPEGAILDCLNRLDRMLVDVSLGARENILGLNDARSKLLSEPGESIRAAGLNVDPPAAGVRVIKDVKKYGKLSAQQKDARYNAMKSGGQPQQLLSQVQSVDFGAATLDAISKAKKGELYGVKSEDLTSKFENINKTRKVEVETWDVSNQAEYSKTLANSKIEKEILSIQRKYKDDLDETIRMRKAGNIPRFLPSQLPLVSEAALEALVDQVIDEANKDKKNTSKNFKYADSNADEYEVSLPIGKPKPTGQSRATAGASPSKTSSGSNGGKAATTGSSGSLDETLTTEVPDMINNIRSEPPDAN